MPGARHQRVPRKDRRGPRWNYVRSGVDIQDNRRALLPEFTDNIPDANRSPRRLFNFDDGGGTAENSYYTNDWITGWQHAAVVQGLAGGAVRVASPFPPQDLDSDDDTWSDVAERGNNWLVDRSESPYIQKALNFDGAGTVFVDELVDGDETRLYGMTNWTIEAWVRPTQTPTNIVPLITRRTKDGNFITCEIGLINTSGVVRAYTRFNRSDPDIRK